jgi:hypothetical protein
VSNPKVRLSDAEIICAWMEPKPPTGMQSGLYAHRWSPNRVWWHTYSASRQTEPVETPWVVNEWEPRPMNLDALWKVEERLTDCQMSTYERELNHAVLHAKPRPRCWYIWHADKPARIKALAAVLRAVVEASA